MSTFTLVKETKADNNYALYEDGKKVATWDERHMKYSYVLKQAEARLEKGDELKEVAMDAPFPKELKAPKAAPKVAPK